MNNNTAATTTTTTTTTTQKPCPYCGSTKARLTNRGVCMNGKACDRRMYDRLAQQVTR
jgi:glutaredoxin